MRTLDTHADACACMRHLKGLTDLALRSPCDGNCGVLSCVTRYGKSKWQSERVRIEAHTRQRRRLLLFRIRPALQGIREARDRVRRTKLEQVWEGCEDEGRNP